MLPPAPPTPFNAELPPRVETPASASVAPLMLTSAPAPPAADRPLPPRATASVFASTPTVTAPPADSVTVAAWPPRPGEFPVASPPRALIPFGRLMAPLAIMVAMPASPPAATEESPPRVLTLFVFTAVFWLRLPAVMSPAVAVRCSAPPWPPTPKALPVTSPPRVDT